MKNYHLKTIKSDKQIDKTNYPVTHHNIPAIVLKFKIP